MEFELGNYSRFAEIPLDQLEMLGSAICIVDFNWNCLFFNKFAYKRVNITEEMIGKNVWSVFPVHAIHPDLRILKKNLERKKLINLITTSPLTGHRISIIGYILEDCFVLLSTTLTNKEDLITDLRNSL
jgi:hypothetical protein